MVIYFLVKFQQKACWKPCIFRGFHCTETNNYYCNPCLSGMKEAILWEHTQFDASFELNCDGITRLTKTEWAHTAWLLFFIIKKKNWKEQYLCKENCHQFHAVVSLYFPTKRSVILSYMYSMSHCILTFRGYRTCFLMFHHKINCIS